MVSLVLGGRAVEDDATREFRLGLETLYGTQAWFQRPPDLTPEEVMSIIADEQHPDWFRFRTEVEYITMSRDADLTYLRFPEDVRVDAVQRELTFIFPFLKNDLSGTFGVIKTMKPVDWDLVTRYLESVRNMGLHQVFPQTYGEYLAVLKGITGPHGSRTRALRRGAAQVAADVTGPADIQTALGHRNVATQRTYLGKQTRQCQEKQLNLQRRIWGHLGLTPRTGTEGGTQAQEAREAARSTQRPEEPTGPRTATTRARSTVAPRRSPSTTSRRRQAPPARVAMHQRLTTGNKVKEMAACIGMRMGSREASMPSGEQTRIAAILAALPQRPPSPPTTESSSEASVDAVVVH